MSLSDADKKTLSRDLKTAMLKGQIKLTYGFHNFMNTVTQADAVVISIEDQAALLVVIDTINKLNNSKKPNERIIVRTAGGGKICTPHSASYSATNVANANIIIRLTGKEFADVTQLANTNIVRVGASMQIGDLDQLLYEKFKLVLPTSSLLPYATVAGLTAAGGHGTGKNQPGFAGLVRGMTFCLETGEIKHIDYTHPDFATMLGAHNGLFGIVLDLDIACVPAKKMQCVMEKRSAMEFIEEAEDGLFTNDPYVSVMYVPTYLPDEMTNRAVKNVIIYRWRPVPLDTNNSHYNPIIADLEQEVQTKLDAAVNINEILREYPKIIPFYMRHLTAPLAIGDADQLAVGNWPEIMHYRTWFPDDLDEICGIFPVQDQPANAPQCQEIVNALKQTITLLGEHAKRGEYPLTYGVYFRYLQGSNGGLAITTHPEGSHICGMDLTTCENAPGFAAFKQSMQDFFLNDMNGKLHWGKNAPMDIDYAKIYGATWQETKSVLERWHQVNKIDTTKSIFLNPLFSKVFGYPLPSLDETANVQQQQTPARKHLIAINAKKLHTLVTDHSAEAHLLEAVIDADIAKAELGKRSTGTHCLFAPPVIKPRLG
jgi:hypothetical protein